MCAGSCVLAHRMRQMMIVPHSSSTTASNPDAGNEEDRRRNEGDGNAAWEIAGSRTETNACTACQSGESPDRSTAIRVLQTSSKFHRGGREERAARFMSLLGCLRRAARAQRRRRGAGCAAASWPNGCHGALGPPAVVLAVVSRLQITPPTQ